ncbi:MAG: PDZ domain-containing protein [Oscillochloris sp.]|nr:PDZ domain-containing protein [Oscillochloris sp.]
MHNYRRPVYVTLLLLLISGCTIAPQLGFAPTPTVPPLPTALPTAEIALSPTATAAPSETASPTPLPSATPTPSITPEPSPTFAPLPPTPTLPALSADERSRIFEEVWTLVRDRYLYEDYGGNDWDAVRADLAPQVAAVVSADEFYALMRGMIERLNDEHSRFETPQDVAAQQAEFRGELKYGGIGAIIRTTEEGGLVINVAPGSPAEQSGIQPRELIVAINGISFVDSEAFGSEGPIGMVRGEPGTAVRLTVRSSNGNERELDVIRAPIDQDVFNQVVGRRLAGTNVGYVEIPSFYVDAIDTKVRAAVEALLDSGDLDGLILDVRANSGGYVHLMRNSIGLFVDGGVIGTTSGRSDSESQIIPNGQVITGTGDLPIAVLISEETASAAEMFAAGMQVLGRAQVIGTASAGNTENLYSYTFDDGSRLLLAEVAYRLPDGSLIEGTGVLPDREVAAEWWRYDPELDPQVLAAIEQFGFAPIVQRP